MSSFSRLREVYASFDELQILGRGLAIAARLQLVLDALAFIETADASPLEGRDVHEGILAPSSGVIKPKPFIGLNHFTGPIAMYSPSLQTVECHDAHVLRAREVPPVAASGVDGMNLRRPLGEPDSVGVLYFDRSGRRRS